MHFLRAGLFAITITIALCIAVTSGVPLPTTKFLSNSYASTLQTTDIHHHLGEHTRHSGEHVLISKSDGVPWPDAVGLERRSIFSKIKNGFKKVGRAINHVAKKIGHGIKKAAKKIRSGIKKVTKKAWSGVNKVAKKVGSGIKKVAKKVGHGIKTAAKKVGHFVKTKGPKIAKVGLKVVSTATKVASKVAEFMPIPVGRPLSKVLDGASAVTNTASNAIHVKIGGKIGEAMNAMDETRKIADYIPRELPKDALEERELEELNARYDFVEDMDLDDREICNDSDGVVFARDWDEFGLGF